MVSIQVWAQDPDTLLIQDFETTPATPTWTYTGTPNDFQSGYSSSTSATPTSSPLGIGGSRAWHVVSVSGGNPLEFANASLPSGYDSFSIVFRVAAMNLSYSGGGGPDNLDYVLVELSTNNGSTYYSRLRVRGSTANNSTWAYSATGLAEAYYTPMSEVTFQPTTSGPQTTYGYSTVKINIPNTESQIKVRITPRSSSSSDSWLVDNLVLLGWGGCQVTTTHDTVCSGNTATLSASLNRGGIVKWYDSSASGNFLAYGSSYTTGTVTAEDTFYAEGICGPVDTMDVGTHASPYSGNVRGYVFISPIDFVITGLRIPNDLSGSQNVSIVRFNNSAPPYFPSTTNDFVTLGYWTGVNSTDFIDTSILILEGDTIGIYGNRNDVNSYGNGPYSTMIGDSSVTLYRSGMQYPLSSNQLKEIWQQSSGNISRVDMRYIIPEDTTARVPAYVWIQSPSYDTISPSVCDTYTSPSGKTWTTSGTRNDTIPNAEGCDSIITINLTVKYSTSSSFTVSAYDSFVSPSGKVWTSSDAYMDTIPNAVGCDSVMSFGVEIIHKLFVNNNMSSSGNGNSWGTAFKTLDEALSFANGTTNSVEIWVRSGTYYPSGSQSHSNRDTSFVITNPNTILMGGFSGVETDTSQRNPTVNPTILCGDIGNANDSTDNSYHLIVLVCDSDVLENFVIDGFTIRDGNANGKTTHDFLSFSIYQNQGAGLLIYSQGINQEMSPTIRNCIFRNNYAYYGSTIYITARNGESHAVLTNNTYRDNNSAYGTVHLDGRNGEVTPFILNSAFSDNHSLTSGAAIFNYSYGGEASPSITNCVFNENNSEDHGGAIYNNGYNGTSDPVIYSSTFYGNNAVISGGAMYSFGASGSSSPLVAGSIFEDNTKDGDNDHNFSEFYNYQASPYVTYSSVQRNSGTYSSSNANSLNGGANNYYDNNPAFENESDGDGDDDVWRTGDDGLRLTSSSPLLNAGYNTSSNVTDILGNTRVGTRDMGAYEYVSCGLHVKLATAVKTHTASQAVNDGEFTCYCNDSNELLLALDTNGSGAVISPGQVRLYIGNPSTLSYDSAGGMISNPYGGVILERRWDVDPTSQPTGNVRVRYFYTNDNYNDIVTAMSNLSSPTSVVSPSQLQFYKVLGGSSDTFPNPHDNGVYGIILTNGTSADTNVWVAGIHGVQDHYAEYLVYSFSGGGGGGGGGSAPLPVELLSFEAKNLAQHSARLDWITASEINNSHFVIQRSYDGLNFSDIGTKPGNGTTNHFSSYQFDDHTISSTENMVFYRLKQVDFDGTEAFGPIRMVEFDAAISKTATKVFPNPTKGEISVIFPSEDEADFHQIVVMDNMGRTIKTVTTKDKQLTIDLSEYSTGVYFISTDLGDNFKLIKL